ncbi:hypothetical protein SmJEL517_g03657 [Synchytrium microbalum]|uniref:Uncharacterized protein n=1 Tax=Synchytrium microbalum TaxID=1806994 RepID=A0A507C5U0_9FUNG|nr:uncharacterized protein SmJEL517_g03657 [Synchytrium microbalum]TPX33444.1 hypothetical protein SmJEL517_g03657 [Synchytrium microbalum]
MRKANYLNSRSTDNIATSSSAASSSHRRGMAVEASAPPNTAVPQHVDYDKKRRETLGKLDIYYQQVCTIILERQNAVTGLIPASVAVTAHGDYRDAWVRDNVYSILAVWGVSLAYRRIDDEQGRGYELEHATAKCMRGLLFAMMGQAAKVEKFKNTQSLTDCLHAKYNTSTGATVVGDSEWGHLQIDATSIFIFYLAQMTASGMQIVYTMDEVNFVQNLVFYIERAYRTPDYGIWERGNKLNHGMPELNSSSIGMAVAALQAINGINLFGGRGGSASVIHVLPDEITRNVTTLQSALPRESNSKEVDAAILSVISFPAFAVSDYALVNRTRNEITKKLGGKFGMKRFLRDGHQTELEDNSRGHYNPHELQVFENIESEWPLFFTYMVLDGFFRGDITQAEDYLERLKPLLVDTSVQHNQTDPETSEELRKGTLHNFPKPPPVQIQLVPEIYKVPKDLVDAEKNDPGSQQRVPNENVPLVWAQSLYTLGLLLKDDLVTPAELDPLGRRFVPNRDETKKDAVVQVVLLAESSELQAQLATFGLSTQTREECDPITISPPSALRDAYVTLGANTKLGLTGRPLRPIGTLSTSKMYRCHGKLYCFLPHFMDREEFFLVSDYDYLASVFEQELAFVRSNWSSPGRPTMAVMLTKEMIMGSRVSDKSPDGRSQQVETAKNLLNLFLSLRSGNVNGVRVRLGRLGDMVNTACIESLDFLSYGVGGQADWHQVLKGPASWSEPSKLSKNVTSASVGPGARQRKRTTRRRVSQSGDAIGSKSPLSSPYYTEDPSIPYNDSTFSLDHSPPQSIPVSPLHANGEPHANGVSNGALASDAATTPDDADSKRTNIATSALTKPQSEQGSLTARDDHGPTVTTAMERTTSPTPTSEMLTLTLGDPSHIDQAVSTLSESSNMYEQIDLLHYLFSCNGLDYSVGGLGTVRNLLEEVYVKATTLRQWNVVRHAAGLLRKVVNSLTVNVADLLIRQRPVTIGFGGDNEFFIASPMNPGALVDIIYNRCASDVREAPLVQEVFTYLGSFIRSSPDLFDGIMRLRTHLIIIAMRDEIARIMNCDEAEAVENLMQLSPFEMKTLLGEVLSGSTDSSILESSKDADKPGHLKESGDSVPAALLPSNGKWLRRRKDDGALNRVPDRFYPRVWKILSKVHGILVGKAFLPRDPTVSEKTEEELAFALQLEAILDVIRDPAERQITVECLVVIARMIERNPELRIKEGTLDLLAIVRDAILRCWTKFIAEKRGETIPAGAENKDAVTTPHGGADPEVAKFIEGLSPDKIERLARRLFFDLPCDGKDGTMAYLASSCLRACFDEGQSR